MNARHVANKTRWKSKLAVAVLLGAVAIVTYMQQPKRDEQSPRPLSIEEKSTNPTLEAKVLEIAAKFICSCGTCGEKSLDICTCDRAVEERQFIRNRLQTGEAPEQVVTAVNAAYGWMKKG